MNVTPTSGPIATSSTHHARDDTSSRYSFATSQRREETAEDAELAEPNFCSALFACSAVPSSGKRKKDLLEIAACAAAARRGHGGELLQRPFAARAAAAEQHEAIAHARRVANLVNRQEHRPARRRVGAQRLRHLAALAQVEAVERLAGAR